ncbi:MAG: 50S ribosomal protein L10 [Alphaproteobacteria bacterium]|nr:50S ribosomal protein L10 [Alphaproteobacteria bacterium]
MSEQVSDNRKVKFGKVDQIRDGVKDAELVVVLVQNGLDADQTLALRRAMRAAGVEMKIEKNTLVKLAIKDTILAGLEPYMKGPTALAYSKDPVAAAKVAAEFAKKNDKLKIVAAAMGDQILDAKEAMALASLPSLDELRGKLVGLLVAPATKIACVVQAPAGQLARVISAYSKKEAA